MSKVRTRQRAPTGNRMGWTTLQLSELSEQFVEACRGLEGAQVLDIGTGYGLAAEEALRAGVRVIANDLDATALERLAERIETELRPRLTCAAGRFPRELAVEEGSLAAVHAASVLHFLPPRHLGEGFRAIARWLRPGGRLYVQAATPYQMPFREFVPVFAARQRAGERWPGWEEKIGRYARHRLMGQMPGAIHLLDDRTLRRAANEAGLQVERAWLFRRRDLPRSLYLDGRETAGLVAVKAGQTFSISSAAWMRSA